MYTNRSESNKTGKVLDKSIPQTGPLLPGNSQALDVIVLGASGDLAKKKTYPSQYELFCFNFLPPATKIWGYARSDYEISAFHDRIRPFLLKSKAANPTKIEQFLQLCTYHRGTGYDDVPSWSALGEKLSEDTNRLFYFAIPNTAFGASGKAISKSTGMMVDESNGAFNRFVIEKPFGSDSESSEVLAKELTSLFKEHQLYRIDHYLGKDMVSNILCFVLLIFFSALYGTKNMSSLLSFHGKKTLVLWDVVGISILLVLLETSCKIICCKY